MAARSISPGLHCLSRTRLVLAQGFGRLDAEASTRGSCDRDGADDGHDEYYQRNQDGALPLEHLAFERGFERECADQAHRDAGRNLTERASEDAGEQAMRVCAKRGPDADLPPPLRDRAVCVVLVSAAIAQFAWWYGGTVYDGPSISC